MHPPLNRGVRVVSSCNSSFTLVDLSFPPLLDKRYGAYNYTTQHRPYLRGDNSTRFSDHLPRHATYLDGRRVKRRSRRTPHCSSELSLPRYRNQGMCARLAR